MGDHCRTLEIRCSDGVPGGFPNGNTRSHSPLAGGSQSRADCNRHRFVPQYGAQVPLPSQGQAVAAAKAEGIAQDGPAATEEQLSRLAMVSQSGPRQSTTPRQDQLEPWADQIYQWIANDRLQMPRIHELLTIRGCAVSYPSLRRFVLKRNWRKRSKTTVRMEDTPPGAVAEADFGRLGMITDPATGRRKAVWAMVIVLCHYRHCFVWPMQSQQLEDVISGLETAWAFFGGMPKYLVIDNFPAAVVGPDSLHPILTRGFLEYAQHRGFIADPARVRHPKDKPKVERGVPYARERFFKGADFNDLAGIRAAAPKWCLEVAGMRIHGTTRRKPLVVFQDEERHTLIPWDGEPYEIADWRTLTVHQDYHIQCQQALYSVPSDVCPPGAEGRSESGQQAGAHLPPGQADQDPRPTAHGRPLHR